MKTSNKLKAITLILIIVLIAILSFLGVYNIASVYGDNLVKDYSVGMDLKGKRIFRLKVDDTVNEVTYDSEGNKVETQEEEGTYTVEEVPVNSPEILTKENYEKSVKVIEDRLKFLDAKEYKLRYNEENGVIELELIDDELVNYILSSISEKGEFRLVDDETQEVLLDSNSVKRARVVYSTTDSASTTAYLDIQFNSEGAKKLQEISSTYVSKQEQVVNEEGETKEETVEKKVSVKIDDTSIISTSFSEQLTNGHIYISVGQASNNNEELKQNGLEASIYASIIQSGPVPIAYTVEQNEYIVSNIDKTIIPTVAIIALVVEIILLIVVFRLKGIIASILQIGYVSLLLLVLKYTNVYITLEGVFALVFAGILNLTLLYKILKSINSGEKVLKSVNDSLIQFINVNIPLLIIAIVFCFVNFLEINSFGMTMFWGYVVLLLYNIIFTKGILKNTCEK